MSDGLNLNPWTATVGWIGHCDVGVRVFQSYAEREVSCAGRIGCVRTNERVYREVDLWFVRSQHQEGVIVRVGLVKWRAAC